MGFSEPYIYGLGEFKFTAGDDIYIKGQEQEGSRRRGLTYMFQNMESA